MRETISRALRMMLMLNVPATVGLMVLAHPIVALLLAARALHRVRHRGDGRRADLLCARPPRATRR